MALKPHKITKRDASNGVKDPSEMLTTAVEGRKCYLRRLVNVYADVEISACHLHRDKNILGNKWNL